MIGNKLIRVFRQVLSATQAAELYEWASVLPRDPPTPGPHISHGSDTVGCCCSLCTPEVITTDGLSDEVLNGCLATVQSLTRHPVTHCVNLLKPGARHLHHIDGVHAWRKLIVLLMRPARGGVLSVAPRCKTCTCLEGGFCKPVTPMSLDLRVGDAVEFGTGSLCHGVSTVHSGIRASWTIRPLLPSEQRSASSRRK